MAARNYSSTVVTRQLNAALSSSTSGAVDSLVLDSTTSLPTSYPFTLVIDPDTISEEIITVTGAPSGSTYPITRGSDGTTATSHANNSTVRHMITARDLQDAQNHIEAASGGYTITNDGQGNTTHSLHGIAAGEGNVVGTAKAQTLTNKTISGGTFSGSITSTATITGGTISNATLSTPTINSASINGATLVNTTNATSGTIDLGTNATAITADSLAITAAQVKLIPDIGNKLDIPTSWTSWTPTVSGWSLSNGTIEFNYKQIGKIVHFKGKVTVGSTTTVGGGDLEISLPVTATSDLNWQGIGRGSLTGIGSVALIIVPSTTTTFKPQLINTASTYATRAGITSPQYSRTAGDVVIFSGTYEVA